MAKGWTATLSKVLGTASDWLTHRMLALEVADGGKWDRLAGYFAPLAILASIAYFMSRAWHLTAHFEGVLGVVLAVLVEFAAFVLAFAVAIAALVGLQLLARALHRLRSHRAP